MTKIGMLKYPGHLESAYSGIKDIIQLVNVLKLSDIDLISLSMTDTHLPSLDYLIIPPASINDSYDDPAYLQQVLVKSMPIHHQIRHAYSQGTVICAACVGVFILNVALIDLKQPLTTHWRLASAFKDLFPQSQLDINALVVETPTVITAGGYMAWLDLILMILSRILSTTAFNQLKRTIIFDSADRQQNHYHTFHPPMIEHATRIHQVQIAIAQVNGHVGSLIEFASKHGFHLKTLNRQFNHYFGCSLKTYTIRVKIQYLCDMLESTDKAFSTLAYQVGYTDAGSASKIFSQIMGLSPTEFRQKFKQLHTR